MTTETQPEKTVDEEIVELEALLKQIHEAINTRAKEIAELAVIYAQRLADLKILRGGR